MEDEDYWVQQYEIQGFNNSALFFVFVSLQI